MLKISRDDIDSEEITEFPSNTRFIKLPITPYLRLLGAWDELNRPQVALINAVNNPKYRFICAALSRRLGKTYIANVIAQLITLIPGCNVLLISPNYNLSSISFELQRTFIAHFQLEVTRDNLKDRIIELENGSTVRMGSLSTVDACVGRSYQLIIFDEAALGEAGDNAFNIQLRPTLDRLESKAIFISTPRGKLNWFSLFYNRGYSPEFPEWASITADYTENPRMHEKDVAEARKSMSRAEFEQEYMASFNQFEGQIFRLEESSIVPIHLSEEVSIEVIAGLDPGYKDPTAFVVIAHYTREVIVDGIAEEESVFHIVDEYLDTGTTAVHAAAFRVLVDKWGVEIIFVDSAAAQFAADLTYSYDLSTTKSKKDVLPGIAYVQNLVEHGRLLVSPHCTHTLAAMDQYRWDQRDGLAKSKPVHDDFSHIADAIRYALYSFTASS